MTSNVKALGAAAEFDDDITHQNGNIYNQLLLKSAAAAFTADSQQITRLSFVDLHGDIVQVEFSGAGTVSIVLDGATAPALAANYNQPGINYVTGANEPATSASSASAASPPSTRRSSATTSPTTAWPTSPSSPSRAPTESSAASAPPTPVTSPPRASPASMRPASRSAAPFTSATSARAPTPRPSRSAVSRNSSSSPAPSPTASLPPQTNQANLHECGTNVTTQIVVNPTP